MLPLLCAAVVVGPALGAAAGLCRWFVGVAVYTVGFAIGLDHEGRFGEEEENKKKRNDFVTTFLLRS